MCPLGFSLDKYTFCREINSGVIHLMSIGLDVRRSDSFHVLCGVCTRLIYASEAPRNMGHIGARHLTAKGWNCNSGHWPCSNEADARSSLIAIGALMPAIVEPWFQEHTSLSSVAEEEEERFGIDRARLYLADGKNQKAMEVLQKHLEYLLHTKAWMTPESRAKQEEEANNLLRQIMSMS
jgi:hypothetical protein